MSAPPLSNHRCCFVFQNPPPHVADGGSTALHLACETNRIEVVKLLLQGGADPQLATGAVDSASVGGQGFVGGVSVSVGFGNHSND